MRDVEERMFWAAKNGDVEALRSAVEEGVRVDIIDDGWTALMWAAMNGHEVCARVLVESGADVETRDEWGVSAEGLAMECGHEWLAEWLAGVASVRRERAELAGEMDGKGAGRKAGARL